MRALLRVNSQLLLLFACLPPSPHKNLILLQLHEQNRKFHFTLLWTERVIIRLRKECATLNVAIIKHNGNIQSLAAIKFSGYILIINDTRPLYRTRISVSSSEIIGNFWLLQCSILRFVMNFAVNKVAVCLCQYW